MKETDFGLLHDLLTAFTKFGPMMKKGIFVVFLFSIALLALAFQKNDGAQPVAYSHNMHVVENDMECLDCHQYVEENARASIPNIELCFDCHEDALTESEAESTLLRYITENKKIPWRQVHIIPDYAYFSHRRHVKLAELDCTVCHGDVGALTTPITKPFVEMTMNWCMDCHEEKSASNDCYACHR